MAELDSESLKRLQKDIESVQNTISRDLHIDDISTGTSTGISTGTSTGASTDSPVDAQATAQTGDVAAQDKPEKLAVEAACERVIEVPRDGRVPTPQDLIQEYYDQLMLSAQGGQSATGGSPQQAAGDPAPVDEAQERQKRKRELKAQQEQLQAQVEAFKSQHSDKFTPEEIDTYMNIGSELANNPLLTAVMEIVKQHAPANGKRRKILKRLETLRSPKTGYVSLEMQEINGRLCVSLFPTSDPQYRPEIDIPAGYEAALIGNYNMLKGVAQAYWAMFCQKHPTLVGNINRAIAPLTVDAVTIDASNITSLIFSPDIKPRVSICCFYVDTQGRLLRKVRPRH